MPNWCWQALKDAGVDNGAAVMILPDGAGALLPISLATDGENGHALLEDYEIILSVTYDFGLRGSRSLSLVPRGGQRNVAP